MAKRKPKPQTPETADAIADLLKAVMAEAKGVAGVAGDRARDVASKLGAKAQMSSQEAKEWMDYLRQMLSGGEDLPPVTSAATTASVGRGGARAAARGMPDIDAVRWQTPKGLSMFDPDLGVVTEVVKQGGRKGAGLLSRAASMGAKGLGVGLRALGPLALAGMVIPEVYDRVANPEARAHRGAMNLAAYDALTDGADENQLLREMEQENEDLQGDIRGEFGRQVSGRNRDLDDIAKLLDSQKEQLRAAQPYAAREGPSLMEIYAAEGLL